MVNEEEEEHNIEMEAKRINDRFESLYFNIKNVFMINQNYFSYYFIDYEFKILKSANTDRPEKNPNKIYNYFQIKRNQIDPEDVKLIEEILLSLNEENLFLYSDGYYSPNKLLKSKFYYQYLSKVMNSNYIIITFVFFKK